MSFRIRLLVLLTASLTFAACSPERGASSASPGEAAGAATAVKATGAPARLVFVDKAECCACTRARIDSSWAALQRVLDDHRLPVERLSADEQEEDVALYRASKPFLALPALYVLDKDGEVISLLQGELSVEQLKAALGPRR